MYGSYCQCLVKGLAGVTSTKLGDAEGLLCQVTVAQLGLDAPGWAGQRGEDQSRAFLVNYAPTATDEDGEKNITAIKGDFGKEPCEITISWVIKDTKDQWVTKMEFKMNKGMVIRGTDVMGGVSFVIAPQLTKESTLMRREGSYTEGVKVVDGSKA